MTATEPAPGVKIDLEPVSFPWMDASRYAFCLGMEAGPAIWLSGHTAARYEAERNVVTADGDLEAQTRIAYEKARVVLEAAGLGLGDVAQSIEYLSPDALGDADAATLARLRQEYLGAHRPALSTVAVDSLLRPEALVELEMVASRAPAEAVEAAGTTAVRAGTVKATSPAASAETCPVTPNTPSNCTLDKPVEATTGCETAS